MFKRRKPDEAQAAPKPGEAPAADPVVVGADRLAVPHEPAGEADIPAFPSRPDLSLGVPPFRPTPAPGSTRIPPKEAPSMGRAPFASTPAPSSPNPSVSVPPPPMRPSTSMPSPAMTAPPAPAPAPTPAAKPAEKRTLVVGRGISVQGTVQDAERLVVEGTVEASMIHASELAISPGGVFKGEVEVDDAEVAGTIDGTLTAKNSLVVRATGRLLGSARCKRLQVEDGGQITGRIEMIVAGASGKAADAA